MGLREKLKYETPFVLNDFPELYQQNEKLTPNSHTQLMLSDRTYQEIFDNFCETILDGIDNKKFIPVYRMADGEFLFVNQRLENSSNKDKVIMTFFSKINYLFSKHSMYDRKIKINKFEILKNIFDSNYRPVAHGEVYTKSETDQSKISFVKKLKELSKNGKLAFHFVKREDRLVYNESIYKFYNWIDANRIDINEENYLPFYHVYAILNSKFRKKLFNNRNILIVTNYDSKKKNALKEYLYKKEDANKVSFIKISSKKSMIDKIDVSQYVEKIDLALVAAGIGSINILLQLKPLSVPCLDIGYALECMANSNLRRDRMFLELQ